MVRARSEHTCGGTVTVSGAGPARVTLAPPPRFSSISRRPPAAAIIWWASGRPLPTPRTMVRASGPADVTPGSSARRGSPIPGPWSLTRSEWPGVEQAHHRVAEPGVHQILHHLAHRRSGERRALADRVAEVLDQGDGVRVGELLDLGGLRGSRVDGQPRAHHVGEGAAGRGDRGGEGEV